MKHSLVIPCETGEVSDGDHTFDELYQHRAALFLALLSSHPDRGWIARQQGDDNSFKWFFIAGLNTPEGVVTYHLSDDLWQSALCTGCTILAKAPVFDGNTSDDCIGRLMSCVISGGLSPIRKTTDMESVELQVDSPAG